MPQDFSPSHTAPGRLVADDRTRFRSRTRPTGYLFDDHAFQALRALGLTVHIEFDIDAWKSFIRSTEWGVINAAVDPVYHDFSAGEVFWLRLSHGSEIVATQVGRMITTDDYVGMVGDHSLFFGDQPSGFKDFRLLPEQPPAISGLVVQLAGLYIKPEWRRMRTAEGMRLVAAWARLTHSFTARNLMADWSVTLVESRLATPRMIQDLYGYANAVELFETYAPDLGKRDRVTLAWMSAEELSDSVVRRPRPIGSSVHRQASMAE